MISQVSCLEGQAKALLVPLQEPHWAAVTCEPILHAHLGLPPLSVLIGFCQNLPACGSGSMASGL